MQELKTRRLKLKDDFLKIRNSQKSIHTIFENNKKEDLMNDKYVPMYQPKHYISMIYNSISLEDLKNIKIKLEFVENNIQRDIWKFYRVYVSKLKALNDKGWLDESKGRNVKILVKDTVTDKYIGILGFSSDVTFMYARDNYIGWLNNKDGKKEHLQDILNLTCCISLQPFGFNFNGGKLLASLAFSKEVFDYIQNKYNNENNSMQFAGITVTSIYGKSVQYSRLPCLKFVGYTKGYGTYQIPNKVYKESRNLLEEMGEDVSKYDNMSYSKMSLLKRVCTIIGLPHDVLKHGHEKGVYFGFTCKNSKEFLNNETDKLDTSGLKPMHEITEWWKTRWAIQRFNHLKSTFKLKYETEYNLYSLPDKDKNKLRVKRHRAKIVKTKKEYYDTDGNELRPGYADIYIVRNKINDKKYIGQVTHLTGTKTIRRNGTITRWKDHLISATRFQDKPGFNKRNYCVKLCRAIQKYGKENFEMIGYLTTTLDHANDWEMKIIEEYDTFENGYNATGGGDGLVSKVYSKEYRKKLSEAKKGDKNPNKKGLSEEHKKNIGLANKGRLRKLSDEMIISILKEKSTGANQEFVGNKFGIERRMVGEIWNGKLLPIDTSLITPEIQELLNKKNTKTTGKFSLSNDEIIKIQGCISKKMTIKQIQEIVIVKKTSKPVSTHHITAVRQGKTIPRIDNPN